MADQLLDDRVPDARGGSGDDRQSVAHRGIEDVLCHGETLNVENPQGRTGTSRAWGAGARQHMVMPPSTQIVCPVR
ncbi:MAG: hypothetical protein AMXMBFR58_17230 [Phycisphaerae bacterium]